MIELTKADKSLLLSLALHGPTIGNRMKPEVRNASRTAKRLKREGMIEGEYTDEYSRAAELLSLTVLGVVEAFAFARPEKWQSIMKRWSDLVPFVFGKWDLFVSSGFKDLACKCLFQTAFEFRKNYWSDVELSKSVANEFGESWRNEMSLMWEPVKELERFQTNFYSLLFRFNALLGTPKDQERLVDVCKSDLEVCDYLVDGLTKGKDVLRNEADHIERVIHALHRDDRVG